jgi:hypothetical protein
MGTRIAEARFELCDENFSCVSLTSVDVEIKSGWNLKLSVPDWRELMSAAIALATADVSRRIFLFTSQFQPAEKVPSPRLHRH